MNQFLPNFIFMTNFCEGRGYKVKFNRTEKGVKGDVYFQKELFKKGQKHFDTCIEAQKQIYSTIYKLIR
jgi:DNA primase